ncbi:hypothetical protein [Vibrio natriegens]|uniref:hypothetical protein n=1 Tax=Vibrio natriegens TaxID=691 RepID=UPI003B5C6F74
MIELILHPGHSKCGSTTIQDFLFTNQVTLKERGIFLPDSEFNFPGNKEYQINSTQTPRNFIGKVIRGELSIATLGKKLDKFLSKAQKQGCKKVVITAENLINTIGSPQQKAIHSLFSSRFDKVTVVYYVREQQELFVSAWQQWGHKEGETLEAYIDKLIKTKFGDFNLIANKLSDYYPTAEVKVRSLDKKHLINSNLTIDFCINTEINTDGLNFSFEASNTGLSSAICESLTKIHTVYESPHCQKVKNAILAYAPNSQHLLNKKYSTQLPQALEVKIASSYLKSNQLLEKRYFSGEEAFPSSKKSENKNTQNEMSLLKQRIEKLEDLVAIQMDMILTLKEQK